MPTMHWIGTTRQRYTPGHPWHIFHLGEYPYALAPRVTERVDVRGHGLHLIGG